MAEANPGRSQQCPNCQAWHDVGVYVTGQKLLCRCGIHFEVRRTDVSSVGPRPGGPISPTVNARPQPNALAGNTHPFALAAEAPPDGGDGAALDVGPTHVSPSRGGGAPAPEPAPEALGQDRTFISSSRALELPGYDLLELLGRGGMGEVWKARQKSLGRTVAVKLLPPRLAKDPEFVARFDKEATALAALSHPNVIQIIDRGVAGENYYFVMEYVEGRSLRELINSGQLPPVEALKLVAQVCRAIDYAHDKQIIHRDLKPENILVDDRGNVKVADFGLAGIGGNDPRMQLTATSVAMGTVNYMAPEQRRDAKHVDRRADLYSVGVVLYELLTGELPIGRFKLPSDKVQGLDRRLDELILRTLEPEPDARYQRASALCEEIEALLLSMGGSGVAPARLSPSAVSPASGSSSQPAAPASVIERGWNGLRAGLTVIGGLAVLAFALKLLPGGETIEVKPENGSTQTVTIGDKKFEIKVQGSSGPVAFPRNTEGELFTGAVAGRAGSRETVSLAFDGAGKEEINAHAGAWQLTGGVLASTQAGNDTGDPNLLRLIPRAYLAHRYYSTDDVTLEVDMSVHSVKDRFPIEPEAQQFGELALRIKDLQVSVFAIPDVGMRLLWRYFTPDGVEVIGNSARDLENLVEDETPVPKGRFRVKLALKKRKNATDVEAYVNGQRFAHKTLVGLTGQTGKIALGCRNLHCEFDDLEVSGKAMPRPTRRSN